MKSKLRLDNNSFKYLEFRGKRRVPYLVGTRINAGALWVDYRCNNYSSYRVLANDFDLPLEPVTEALEWCRKHNNEVTLDCEEERRAGGYTG